MLTDHGSQFADRPTNETKTASGRHAFDQRCAELAIEHRLCSPYGPHINEMVERFNHRISEIIGQIPFTSAEVLETTLKHYQATYNHCMPQKDLNHLSPVQALKQWQTQRPELFQRWVDEHAGVNT